jgi:hypothetical protein
MPLVDEPALVEIERNLEFGPLLKTRGSAGDLPACRKVYVDKMTDQKPRFRVVYWCAPSERRPRQARILAVGVRQGWAPVSSQLTGTTPTGRRRAGCR